MASHINIIKAPGTWSVRTGGAVIGETTAALKLTESDNAPIIYFPRNDIAMAFLDVSDAVSSCPHKGSATHFSIVTKSRTIQNAAWSYATPTASVAEIKDYVAFYNMDEVTIENI